MMRVEVCDARRTPFPDAHFHACVTSPPYYALRAYGSGEGEVGAEARLVDYVRSLVEVGREVRRVLRDDGTWWLNLGDTYREKQLLMVPAQVALALQADGWLLRAEVPWLKTNGMPNSQDDRPTVSHETVYLLAKRADYYFDLDAVRRPAETADRVMVNKRRAIQDEQAGHVRTFAAGDRVFANNPSGRSWRTTDPAFDSLDDLRAYLSHVAAVAGAGGLLASPAGEPLALAVPTAPSGLRHFAMWPPRLVAEMVRASTSEAGCCSACGAPRVRVVARTAGEVDRKEGERRVAAGGGALSGGTARVTLHKTHTVQRETTGWRPSCACGAPPAPCRVLDPFSGSGTTAAVADALGRDGYGVELNPAYAAFSEGRRAEVRAYFAREADRRPVPGAGEKFNKKLRALLRAQRSAKA